MTNLSLFLFLALALVFSKILARAIDRWKLPAVLAELFTGLIIANAVGLFGLKAEIFLQNLNNSEVLEAFAEFGALLLLFIVGLETEIAQIAKVGRDAALSATMGVVAPSVLAIVSLGLIGIAGDFNHTLFLAATLSATSVGITARVLKDLKQLRSSSGQIILGAAVIDDVLGIIVLAIVSALVSRGSISSSELGILAAKIGGFILLIAVIRKWVIPKTIRAFVSIETQGIITVLLISVALAFAFVSEALGLAGIVGAFAVGLILDETHFKDFSDLNSSHKPRNLEDFIKPVADYFVPIFFIVMGLQVKLSALANPQSLSLAALLIVCGILGKLACGLFISKKSRRNGADRLFIGLGMIPRGEVGIIFASMGSKMGIFNDADYAAVICMVAVTTLLAPFALAWRTSKN